MATCVAADQWSVAYPLSGQPETAFSLFILRIIAEDSG